MNQHSSRAASEAIGDQHRWVWALAMILLVFGVAALWYWNERPANVQAAIAEVSETTKQRDVMTVEAISEPDKSVVGRSVSVVSARVTAVTSARAFWIIGDDEDSPLLVMIDLKAVDQPLNVAPGDRISVMGVVRDAQTLEAVGSQDRTQLARAQAYLAASDVRPVR